MKLCFFRENAFLFERTLLFFERTLLGKGSLKLSPKTSETIGQCLNPSLGLPSVREATEKETGKLGFICLFKLQFEYVGTGVMTLPCKSYGPKYVWDIRSFLFENNTFISCADKKRTKEAAEWAFDQVKL